MTQLEGRKEARKPDTSYRLVGCPMVPVCLGLRGPQTVGLAHGIFSSNMERKSWANGDASVTLADRATFSMTRPVHHLAYTLLPG